MPDSKRVLEKILNSASEQPLAIFDLDSTLYNVSHRTQKILQKFIEQNSNEPKFISDIEKVRQVQIEHTDWGLKEAFTRTGLALSQEFSHALRDFWKKHFFSSDYLMHDKPYEGAVNYVNTLYRAGVKICYLTGRDDKNMRPGTIESLRVWQFPLDAEHHDLIMKPTKGSIEDDEFKDIEIKRLKSRATKIWFFENEPLIINRVLKSSPEIQIVWIDTTHSRRAEPPTELHVIRDVWHL